MRERFTEKVRVTGRGIFTEKVRVRVKWRVTDKVTIRVRGPGKGMHLPLDRNFLFHA